MGQGVEWNRVACSCEHDNEPMGSIKAREFLEVLRDCGLSQKKKGLASWSKRARDSGNSVWLVLICFNTGDWINGSLPVTQQYGNVRSN
jgi:hypothetical protein